MSSTLRPNRLSMIATKGVLALGGSTRPLNVRKSADIDQQSSGFKPIRVVGQGNYGIVYASRGPDGETYAVKKIMQDPRFKNKELEILGELNSKYCLSLKSFFKTSGRKHNEVYLNFVTEYMPMSLHNLITMYRKERKYLPMLYVKLFGYEMFAGLKDLHAIDITHRDIKPQNVLVDPVTGHLKLCDFGSAKRMKNSERSVSYIASRFYRAPELVLDCPHYTSAVDIWAAGCVIVEAVNAGASAFPGQTSIGQLDEIIKVIGAPTDADLRSFHHLQNIQIDTEQEGNIEGILPKHAPEDLIKLLTSIFVFSPKKRLTAVECMQHPFFDDLFRSEFMMPDGRSGPKFVRPT